jgi:GxxExxY protein
MKSGNHGNHEEHKAQAHAEQEHEEDPFSARKMRTASPLSVEEERIMYQVIGSAISVHRALGPGFLESVYRRAVCIELDKRNLPYECEHPIDVTYGEIPISGQRIDLIVGGLVIVELKAAARLEEIHRAQLISYLRASGLRGGLLINFRVRVLKDGIRRIVLT